MGQNFPPNKRFYTAVKGAKFPLGNTVMTVMALQAIMDANQDPTQFFARHQSGDWGEVGPEDAKENELSVKEGYRILSAYYTVKGVKLWIITEADRSATTILLPEEY